MRLLASALHAAFRGAVQRALPVTAVIVLALACGTTAGARAIGQTVTAPVRPLHDAGDVDRFLASAVGELGGGCSLLLVRDGETIYERSFGGADGARPVRIASATKWLTGAVILSLVDAGKLRLDDHAARFLPGLSGSAARITVRQLLSHTSGLPMAHPALERRDITLSQAVEAIVAAPLMHEPGEACVYGDVSVQVAGRIAEIASGVDAGSGRAWKSIFASRLAIPLDMTATTYEGAGPTDNPHLAGGATSTAAEYARFLTMILSGGTFRGRRVLSESAIAEMLRDQTRGSPLRFNPFGLFPDLSPGWRDVRYGICNWLETVDAATGRAWEASSPGVFGFIPWIDLKRQLAGVFVAQSDMEKSLSVYLRLKALLRRQIPEQRR
jgi:CubicO group peptidase (beta-lactamase class C family)